MKDLKSEIDFFKFKQQLIKHEKIEETYDHIVFIESFKGCPEYIKYV